MALQAGASGLPFTPVPGLIGSDLMRVRPDFRMIPDPYNPAMQVAIVPAIAPEIALVHALRADPDGNLVLPAGGDAPLLIQAARFVIATAEQVCDAPFASLAPDEQIVPGIHVNVVSPAPWGAHPQGCHGLYREDTAHVRRYVQAARDPASFAAYLREYVFEPADGVAYLERIAREPVRA